ncbi:MAG TPA: FixH family protein [Polyangiaceae bacterium]|nr:FixH family protein [Polyangiaceae bacterium]
MLAIACCFGCSSEEDPPEHSHPGDGGNLGTSCDGIADYFAGIKVEGEQGVTVTLVDSAPAPPTAGQNVWTIEVRDAGDQPVDGATIVARPWMPKHGHGETPPAVSVKGNGRYELSPVYFRMSGPWEITFDITLADQTSDSPVLALCIQG